MGLVPAARPILPIALSLPIGSQLASTCSSSVMMFGWRFSARQRAMLVQRARSDWMGGDREAELSLDSDDHRWRAFQIGFVLMARRGRSGSRRSPS